MIALLEQKSGYMVHVSEDPHLPVISTLRVARGNLPAHMLTYKPGLKKESPDYSIIFQCAMSMRMFECPPADRKLIANSPEGHKAMLSICAGSKYGADPLHLSDAFLSDRLHEIITHLRSIPIGLRVTETLTLDYPELLEAEVKQAEWELQMGKDSLADHVRENTPMAIFNLTHNINAAYALFWADRLERPALANPFLLAGFERQGKDLLEIFAEIPADPLNDYELIDRWAEYLHIRDWYQWIPYEAP